MAEDMDFEVHLPLPIPNAALSYLAYHQYVLDDGTLHVEDTIALDDFVMYNLMVDHSFPPMRAENDLVLFLGEDDQSLQICVPSDKAKKFVWSLLDAHSENERQGICFGGFNWNNLSVSRSTGKAKFHGVALIRDLVGPALINQLGINYTDARDVIADMFVNHVPDDIGDLLHQMQYHFEHRSLFAIHPSLVPMANHSTLFKELFDTLFHVVPTLELHDILQEMRATFPVALLCWKAWVKSNQLLKETYNFNGGLSYVIPHNASNQRNLSRDQKIMLGHLGINILGRNTLTQQELDLIEPLQLLLFLRNRPAHRMEHYRRFCQAYADQDFNSLGSERVTHGRFPLIPAFLQRELHSRGHLWRIPARQMFG